MRARWTLAFVVVIACIGTAHGKPITLQCQLMNSVPRNGGTIPDPPFIWHFHVDQAAGTVDGVRATLSDTQIGWAGRTAPALPTATLLRPGWLLDGHKQPDWRFHSERQIGTIRNEVDGSCIEQR
jgi:hypothetical protein